MFNVANLEPVAYKDSKSETIQLALKVHLNNTIMVRLACGKNNPCGLHTPTPHFLPVAIIFPFLAIIMSSV